MLAKTYSSIVIGIDAYTIEIEANVSTTQRGAENILSIVGLLRCCLIALIFRSVLDTV